MITTRTLGRSGIEVSALGLGTWPIGGVWAGSDGKLSSGWGPVDDEESLRAIRRGLDLGVTLFDTSNNYGCGHSEELLGRALAGHRQHVVLATKFGYVFPPGSREVTGTDAGPAGIRRSLEDSMRRLRTDYIDLFQLHIYDLPLDTAEEVRATLEALVAEGRIRGYGWSTGSVERARVFADGPHCVGIQHNLNVLEDSPEMIALCEANAIASIARSPLAMGLLSGKYDANSTFPATDIRQGWNLHDGYEAGQVRQLQSIREVLMQGGRTLVQGALGWVWARGPLIVPIPGFKTAAQVEELAEALRFGPLDTAQMQEIAAIFRCAPDHGGVG